MSRPGRMSVDVLQESYGFPDRFRLVRHADLRPDQSDSAMLVTVRITVAPLRPRI